MEKIEYCCGALENLINDDAGWKYDLKRRKYTAPLNYKKDSKYYGSTLVLEYCPCCGHKFLEELGDAWEELVEKECGLVGEDASIYNPAVPEEFKSDAWWKNRGL